MTFGQDWGSMLAGIPKESAKKIFDSFVNTGGNFIDTANIYQNGTSEKYVGEFIALDRKKFVRARNTPYQQYPDDPNASGSHRKNLVQSVDSSLKRLNTSYIDLLWIHVWDPMTPIEEVMRALDDLIRSGKILYVGISDTPAWVVSQANSIADLRSWSPFIGIQIMYSLIERTPERELLPMAHALDIGVTAWSPLGSGVLTGKYNKQAVSNDDKGKQQNRLDIVGNPMTAIYLNERNFSIAKEVQEIAREIDRTPSQVALNWIREQNKQNKGVIIPIIGVN